MIAMNFNFEKKFAMNFNLKNFLRLSVIETEFVIIKLVYILSIYHTSILLKQEHVLLIIVVSNLKISNYI